MFYADFNILWESQLAAGTCREANDFEAIGVCRATKNLARGGAVSLAASAGYQPR